VRARVCEQAAVDKSPAQRARLVLQRHQPVRRPDDGGVARSQQRQSLQPQTRQRLDDSPPVLAVTAHRPPQRHAGRYSERKCAKRYNKCHSRLTF